MPTEVIIHNLTVEQAEKLLGELHAERDRYREALEAIVAGNKYSEYRDGEVRIAREALGL